MPRNSHIIERGFGIIAAIVILVILAGLGAFIARLSTTQHIGAALDIQGSRAMFAAQSGIEWALYQGLKGTPPCSNSPGTTTAIGTFNDITVSVNCTTAASGNAVEAGLDAIYLITATACNNTTCPNTTPGSNYVERRVQALVER